MDPVTKESIKSYLDPKWVPNVGHNMIKECSIKFNDLVASKFN